jgi:hypothetical protein
LPKQWKCGKVTPIYKDGPETDPTNYRPITVLPILMKVFEKFVHAQLYDYIKEHNILNSYQSGFRPGHSTCTALLDVTEYVYKNMNDGLLTGVAFLDLKKAFDTVDTNRLLTKLVDIGVEDVALNWFENYLTTRQQSVSLNGVVSESMPIDYGVPQGSILGPLLFTLYINELPNVLNKTKVVLYADDTAIFYASNDLKEIERVLNDELDLAHKWLHENKLTLNVKKTKTMVIGTAQRLLGIDRLNVQINGQRVEHVQFFKYLGAFFDSSLTWEHHIDKIKAKISQRLGVLKRTRPFISPETSKLLYNAMVLPLFDYIDVIWSCCNVTQLNRIQRLQNRAARIILKCHPRTHIADMLQKLNWMTCKERVDFHKATMLFKIVNSQAPDYLSSLVKKTDTVHRYNTRHKDVNMFLPSVQLESGKRSFRFTGADMWNRIPDIIRKSDTLTAFKSGYIRHMVNARDS